MKVTGASGVGATFALAFVSIALWHQRALGQPGEGGGAPGDDDAGGSFSGPPSFDDDAGGSFGGPPSFDDDGTSVDCAQNGTTAHYEEILSESGSIAVRLGFSETGCPNHVNWAINPTEAQVTASVNESIPAYPMMFENGSVTDLSSAANSVGIMRNGVALFSSWAVDKVEEYEDTAFYLEADTFDLCGGHATPDGTYHYHGTPGCLQEQAMVDAGTSSDEHSPILGWAYDGFPVYGQLGPDGIEMKMCGEDGADETHCLDVCSGYKAELLDVDGFKYRYYLSCGFDESFFPFTTNCYRGCCPDGLTCNEKVEACGDDAEEGYKDSYVPEALPTLHEVYESQLIEGNDTTYIGSNDSVNCTLYLGSSSVSSISSSSSSESSTSSSEPEDASAASPSFSRMPVVNIVVAVGLIASVVFVV